MAGVTITTRIPVAGRRDWLSDTYHEFEYFTQQPTASLSDMVFGFLEESEGLPQSVSSEEECRKIENLVEDEEKENIGNVDESKSFWENQHQLLQVIKLCFNFFFFVLSWFWTFGTSNIRS